MSDVHMPNMNGYELQKHINEAFRLPVILISADNRAELEGIQNGAVYVMIKPISIDDLKYIWQFSVWWQKKINGTTPSFREINNQSEVYVNTVPSNGIFSEKTGKVMWSGGLHTRFVEALFILGYHRAVPKDLVQVMNVPGLTREQVASHLQKYRRFVKRMMDGTATEISMSQWIYMHCYSTVVNGNPHLMLINQVKEAQRTGNLEAPSAASNGSSSSGGLRILPPFNPADASLGMNISPMWIPSNYASSSVDMTAEGLSNAALGSVGNAAMGFYTQNTVMEPQNFPYGNQGLVGGVDTNMLPSTYHSGTSSTALLRNNFSFNQAINIGGQESNNLFGGQTSGVQQLGAGQSGAQESWFNDDEMLLSDDFLSDPNLFPEDDFLLDPNLFPGEDHDVFWDDIMNLVAAEDEVAGAADAMAVENSGGNDDNVGPAENKDKAEKNSDDDNFEDDIDDVDYDPAEDN
ncbi:two-component response regulator ORR25 isoform X2 [Daucus carota subsp. sativus]|nr:PREDICTED: two-component response regulator ORR25-like [Daucus carota subsp. sativus]